MTENALKWPYVEVAKTQLRNLADATTISPEMAVIVSVVVALSLWFFLTAAKSIVGEYFKRAWFKHVHRSEHERTLSAARTAKAQAERELAEIASLRGKLNSLLAENDRLQAELIRLRIKQKP